MSRIRSLPPRFSAPPARFSTGATAGPGFSRSDGRSSSERGYGADWQALRAKVLRAEPVCRLCKSAPATEVDHIQRFRGLADPLRLAPRNLRPVCRPCHRSRTARQSHGNPGG